MWCVGMQEFVDGGAFDCLGFYLETVGMITLFSGSQSCTGGGMMQ